MYVAKLFQGVELLHVHQGCGECIPYDNEQCVAEGSKGMPTPPPRLGFQSTHIHVHFVHSHVYIQGSACFFFVVNACSAFIYSATSLTKATQPNSLQIDV